VRQAAAVYKVKRMICVLGGSGFVGSRLCKRFVDSGREFSILDKNVSEVYPDEVNVVDVRDLEGLLVSCVSKPKISSIINLAAEHRDDVKPLSLYDEVNVLGAKNTCELARRMNVNRIVFTSSVAVYGFAPRGTSESGEVRPFNDYGRTKYEAELVYRAWQAEDPKNRSLVIVRPTVIFGERNRGNVYNLLKQIASGAFVMVGRGENRKSMAYVENVAAFLEYSLSFGPGVHLYNYIDKPDFDMNSLVSKCMNLLGRDNGVRVRLPYPVGLSVGKAFDLLAAITGKNLSISSIRVKKFCADSVYSAGYGDTGFVPPIDLEAALEKTLRFEFLEDHSSEPVYYSE
jgi:nucleoside-diphosphate-sugar epimerase